MSMKTDADRLQWERDDEGDEPDAYHRSGPIRPVFDNCNVCGIKLRTIDEDRMGMCERCGAE